MINQVIYILAGILCGASGAWFISTYALSLGLVDQPNKRSSHNQPTPSSGGIGFLLAFGLWALYANAAVSFWLPVSMLTILSLLDDRLKISARIRFSAQITSALLVVLGSLPYPPSVSSLVIVPFWLLFITGTTNFYNFMDGINGIAGVTGVIGFVLIALFTWITQTAEASILLPVALAGACVGFLPFNMPRARVFMGDAGSVLLGFVFGCLIFYYSNDAASFICLISFLFPLYADTLTTLFIRWQDGECLSRAHRRHLYQILSNENDLAHWQVTCGFGVIQLLVGVLMLFCYQSGLIWQVLLILTVSILFIHLTTVIRKL